MRAFVRANGHSLPMCVCSDRVKLVQLQLPAPGEPTLPVTTTPQTLTNWIKEHSDAREAQGRTWCET